MHYGTTLQNENARAGIHHYEPNEGYTSAYPNNMCTGSGTGRNGLVPFGAGRYDSNNQSSHITSSISKNNEDGIDSTGVPPHGVLQENSNLHRLMGVQLPNVNAPTMTTLFFMAVIHKNQMLKVMEKGQIKND